ncbi:glycerophosphodiester phosphodiesterase [Pseudonocardia adelaidensis]|uniref:Glycerophosphodiester phosphodiesterase family protein n=1 Tax=Pseudonocardia adelaidensis TaxID=648754 RepID=A0ABP9NYJ2_9PSEU
MIITGHRGAMGSEPENTLRSFRRAVREGCDEIELDLRVTSDGRMVVLHDATVDRTTDGSGAVAEMTFDEVRALDAGLGEQVPTWAEAVAAVDVRFQAEVKAEAAVPVLAESLRADPDLARRTLVTSSHAEILLAVREELPEIGTGLILGRTPAFAEIVARTTAAGAGTALCGIAGLTVDGVADLHERGFDVTAWPVPDEQALATAVELAVDGVTTDHPDRLRGLVHAS